MAGPLSLTAEERQRALDEAALLAHDIEAVLHVDRGAALELYSQALNEPFKGRIKPRERAILMHSNALLVMLLREGGAGWTLWGVKQPRRKKALSGGKFKPPLVRFQCSGCNNRWDAWVNDDGTLQDPRDARCSCGGNVSVAPDD